MDKLNRQYHRLTIDFDIPEDLSNTIDEYVDYLNNSDQSSKDYYTTEIQMILNWCYRESLLSDDKIQLLREYYQYGGILEVQANVSGD